MPSHAYQLSRHTHVCVTAEGAILLDLKSDAYLGVTLTQARALANLVEGWPDLPVLQEPSPSILTEASSLAQALQSRGILESRDGYSPGEHVASAPLSLVPLAREELIQWQHMPSKHISATHIAAFLRALLITLARLRCASMESIVQHLRARRRRSTETKVGFDVEKARLLVSAYEHIRTWAFTRRGRCLLDSLTLLEFLASYDIYPSWVIGVRARPFAAHSWLQHEQLVLNGTPALVRTFTPILVT
jgi:hypothetical protein